MFSATSSGKSSKVSQSLGLSKGEHPTVRGSGCTYLEFALPAFVVLHLWKREEIRRDSTEARLGRREVDTSLNDAAVDSQLRAVSPGVMRVFGRQERLVNGSDIFGKDSLKTAYEEHLLVRRGEEENWLNHDLQRTRHSLISIPRNRILGHELSMSCLWLRAQAPDIRTRPGCRICRICTRGAYPDRLGKLPLACLE